MGRWIKCSEKMPERDHSYPIFVYAPGYNPQVGYKWDGEAFVDINEEYQVFQGATHWMPIELPAPPID
ncbi:DUF551 domain-containing protein [Serratia marcescens]|uniref:DUF551 domain-containing protein n=2 Tax=Serratia marcescens TaxID=615 RepID=A0ABD5BI62_SERMA|nr:DUF551 domain-containing protein [Serratia marcescens]MCZ6928667.1 hypothetical protein [Serratia marcescens]MDE5234317.1 DUF551 domain-containing protein [Serratia marcescens]MDE5257516.1 DUF551 domain-containing protein [Serratia marcescens]MDQ9402272.1 DUF551 domain-containing protein [Serratia marcescens]MDQ9424677.1 DUF551 domain-containing protein [Serratia marcescens]